MKALKIILVVLLFFISIVFTFNEPGARPLESFISLSERNTPLPEILLKYPPGVYYIYRTILKKFPPSLNAALPNQSVWVAWKLISFISYLLTWIALLYLSRTKKTADKLDTTLFFFASAAVALIGLSLGLFEAFALAPLILSLHFLISKKLITTTILYFAAVSFNWYLLILSPFYLVFILKNYPKPKALPLGIIYLVLLFLVSKYLFWQALNGSSLPEVVIASKYLSFSNIFNTNLYFTKSMFTFSVFGVSLYTLLQIFVSGGVSLIVSYAIKKLLKIRLNYFLISIIIFGVVTVGVINQNLYFIFLALFLGIFLFILRGLYNSKSVTPTSFLQTLLTLFCVGSLFFPNLSDGNLIFIPLFTLLLYILTPNEANGKLLLGANIVTFIAIFLFNGVSNLAPLKGAYFEFMRILLTFAVLFFYSKVATGVNLKFINKFLIALLVLFNFALLASDGTSDIVAWREYSYALAKYPNPFYAQTVVDQRYPPLSTVILGAFTTGWKKTFGLKAVEPPLNPINVVEYGYPAKASVIFFYFLTLWIFIKISTYFKKGVGLTKAEKLFAGLTVFSLIIQTQGFVDFNIHVIPTLILSIFALFKRKYFLSGLLMGITVSIKWQPVILIPVFGATLFTFEDGIKEAFKKSLKFLFGLVLIPILVWGLVIIQPGGREAFNRSFSYLRQGAPMFSGQALNLNWLVTYAVHIFQPEKDVSLAHLEGLNRQIDTPLAPKIFQGYLFIAASFVILCFYWLKQKKGIVNFMAASIMIFFSHQILNKSAYEKHLFYTVILMLFLYLIRPSKINKVLLAIFDVMTIMNLIFFYGFTGPKIVNRMVFGFDITILFSLLYLLIYLYVFARYLNKKLLASGNDI